MKRIVAVAAVLVVLAIGVGAAVSVSGRSSTHWSTVQLAQSDKAGGAATGGGRKVTVSSSNALMSALASAHAGDTILLAPGTYSGLRFDNVNFSGAVTIASADVNNKAVVNDFTIDGGGGLTFQDLDLHANVFPGYSAYTIRKSRDLTFNRVSIHGSLDGNPQNDQDGIGAANSSNITITNSEFQQLGIGFQSSNNTNVLFANNYVHDLRVDGMEIAGNKGIRIANNYITNFYQLPGDHNDAIQFWSENVGASSDVTITGNVITRGAGNVGEQGAFFDDIAKSGYKRITISDNLLIGTGYNGIAIMGAESPRSEAITITDNELWSIDDNDSQTWIRLEHTSGAVVRGNKSNSMIFPAGSNANLTEKENKKVSPVGRKEAGPAKDWLSRHPEMSWVQQYLR